MTRPLSSTSSGAPDIAAESGWVVGRALAALRGIRTGCVELVLPSGRRHAFGDLSSSLRATVRVHRNSLFRRVLTDGEIGLGEAYVDGDWDCADLPQLLRIFHENAAVFDSKISAGSRLMTWMNRLRHRLRRNTIAGSRANIREHYDLGNDLFELMLDPTMSYSCALFRSPGQTLEEAQREKLAALIDKARLSQNHHLLDLGCGWGGLAVEAATRTGCQVTGVTLSERQLEFARRRASEMQLADRVRFELADYRDLEGRFDRIISVEMIEAVGHEYLGRFFAACDRLLAPDGLFVLQAITFPDQRYEAFRRGIDWLRTYIFPGSNTPSLTALCEAMTSSSRFVVDSLSNIADHYVPTLRHWRENITLGAERLEELGYDARFRRLWTYYLSYCEAGFAARTFGDLQLVLTRPNSRSPCNPDLGLAR
ncbi:MAG: cyclopropane-fatty-acyl-phospholipid synthase family protein [Acidobacteriota bacterium]|nr:cyclopropane-fatty-acyl-phospholipid synthase family protein [Acidobacteriota bacterium]